MTHALALIGIWLTGGLGASGPASEAPPYGEATAPPAAAAATPHRIADGQQVPPVRIWVEEDHDLFYPGDYARLRFSSASDAYVAVLHVDTEGNLDLLFPRSPWDDELVRAQRSYSLPGYSAGRYPLGRTPGIGYFYIIASPYPLDLRFFRTGVDRRAELWGMGRVVRGDPFWMLEQLTQFLVPEWRYTGYAVDVFSYHLGGRHRYPTFACYDRFARLDAWGHYAYYPSCDRLHRLLVTHPHYYDTRRFRGDRGVYLSGLREFAPRHGFKEVPDRIPPPVRRFDGRDDLDRPTPRGRGIAPAPAVGQQQEPSRAQPRPTTPTRQRPTLERRGGRDTERAQPAEPRQRAEPQPRQRAEPQSRQRAEPQPRRDAPRQREEGRRSEPPPQRESARAAPRPSSDGTE